MITTLDKDIEYIIEISSSIEAYFQMLSYNLNILLKNKVIKITGVIAYLKNSIYSLDIIKSNLSSNDKYRAKTNNIIS